LIIGRVFPAAFGLGAQGRWLKHFFQPFPS